MSHVDTYNAFGAYTWNMPAGAVQVNVKAWSATGGGQSGTAAAFQTGGVQGGQGGNEAGYAEATYLASVLPASVAVNIARAGAGGAPAVSAPAGGGVAPGNPGSNPSGGLTRFGPLATPYVSASNPSAGGQANIVGTGSVAVSPAWLVSLTQNGAVAGPGGLVASPGTSNGKANGTGGSGGFVDNSVVAQRGGNSASGGLAAASVTNASGPPAVGAPSAGGGSIVATAFAGAITASAGGAGTQPGGAGGGGGGADADDGALNPSATSGAGGAGVDGVIIVTTLFASDFLPTPNFPFMFGRVPLNIVPLIVAVNHTRPVSTTGKYKA